MTVRRLWAGAAIIGLLAAPVVMAGDPGADCDRLAASPNDPAFARSGVAHLDIDPAAAREACTRARDASPNTARFAFQLGRAEDRLGNYDAARRLYEEAAAKGYRLADVALAILHEDGLGVDVDTERARALYESAAAAGIGVALNNIGSMYEDGRGYPADREQALDHYRRAAAAGYARAAGNLAWMLEHDPAGVRDPGAVVEAYAEAARRDVAFAQIRLGVFYRDGVHVAAADPHAALAHFERAAAAGDRWGALYAAQTLIADVRSIEADPARGLAMLGDLAASADGDLLGAALATRAEYVLTHGGQPDEAVPLIRRAVEVAPEEAAVWAARAMLLERQGDLDGADEAIARAIEAEDDFAPWYARRAALLDRRGDTAGAEAMRRKAEEAPWGGFFLRTTS